MSLEVSLVMVLMVSSLVVSLVVIVVMDLGKVLEVEGGTGVVYKK